MGRVIIATWALTGLLGPSGCVATEEGAACRDIDGDGFGQKADPSCLFPQVDCNDANPFVNPGAPEVCGNGLDDDCRDGDQPCEVEGCRDRDGDGYGVGEACLGPDCDDADPAVHPRAAESCGDGIDQDCDGIDDRCAEGCIDRDGDGFGRGPECWGADCDDADPAVSPDAVETCGDGVDQDCDGADEPCADGCTDGDGDGTGIGPDCARPDCDDADPRVFPGAEETCGNGIDEDCDGTDRPCPPPCADADGDGFGVGPGCWGPDCDDAHDAVNPDALDVCGNGRDEDCSGADEPCPIDCVDADGDGFGAGPGCWGPDCDDTDGAVSPDAAEICGDGIDNDCTGDDEPCAPDCVDADGDGFGDGPGCWGPDCDDSNDAVNPDAMELCGDGLDNDCRGGDEACGPRCGDGWVSLGLVPGEAMSVEGDVANPDPDRGAPWILLSRGVTLDIVSSARAAWGFDPALAACITSISVYAYAYDDSWFGIGAYLWLETADGAPSETIANVDGTERWYGAVVPATDHLACDAAGCAVRVRAAAAIADNTHLREIEVRIYLSPR